MCRQVSENENQVLVFSALLASLFAIGGIVFGLMFNSLVILFDGVYSTVSLLLTILSLAVSKFIQTPSKRHFPFGKAILEPIVISIKAIAILIVVGGALYSAVEALFTGGREMDASVATLFGGLNVIGCGYAWWYIARRSQRYSSDLITAESMQWQMDTLLSIAITIGFVIAWGIAQSPLAEYAVYADPLMMCGISVYFIKVPIEMLREAVKELLMMTPSHEIHNQVTEGINRVDKIGNQKIKLVGLTKVGRELRLNVDINTQSAQSISINDIERTKKSITSQLSSLPFDLHLNLNIAR